MERGHSKGYKRFLEKASFADPGHMLIHMSDRKKKESRKGVVLSSARRPDREIMRYTYIPLRSAAIGQINDVLSDGALLPCEIL